MHRIILLSLPGLLLTGCTEEQQNRLARLGVTWLEGNYRVTYADGEHVKSWEVRDSNYLAPWTLSLFLNLFV